MFAHLTCKLISKRHPLQFDALGTCLCRLIEDCGQPIFSKPGPSSCAIGCMETWIRGNRNLALIRGVTWKWDKLVLLNFDLGVLRIVWFKPKQSEGKFMVQNLEPQQFGQMSKNEGMSGWIIIYIYIYIYYMYICIKLYIFNYT